MYDVEAPFEMDDLETILSKSLLELTSPTLDNYYLQEHTSAFQVNISGKILQESKVRNITNVDAAELMEVFYNSVVKSGIIGESTDIYQGWLNQHEDSYLSNYSYSISLRSSLAELNRQNYAAEGIGSICAGYSATGILSVDESTLNFTKPNNISTGKIPNSQVSWSYDLSACTQYSKLKHLFKLFLPSSTTSCYYVALFTTYDYSMLGSLALNYASLISKGQTELGCVNRVIQPVFFEKPQVKDVLSADVSSCIDVVVALKTVDNYLPQVFWKSGKGTYKYLDPLSSTKQEDGTEVLRVLLPELEQEKQVWVGVKAKYFDDLYSDMVKYNAPASLVARKYVSPFYSVLPVDSQFSPVQCPLPIFPVNIATFTPSQPEKIPVDSLTPLQLLVFRGSTLAATYAIKNQVAKMKVEDTFAVFSCAIFSGNMRTIIVCQAYHMWNMQLIPKESLLALLQVVINHDHFNQPLTTAEMLCCLPRSMDTEKQLDTISQLFTEPLLHKTQNAFEQLNFVVSNSTKPLESTSEVLDNFRPFASSLEPTGTYPTSSCMPQSPQSETIPPTSPPQTLMNSNSSQPTQKTVSYQEVHDFLFPDRKQPSFNYLFPPKTNYLAAHQPLTSQFSQPLFVDKPGFFIVPPPTPLIETTTQIASSIQPAQIMKPLQSSQIPTSLQTILPVSQPDIVCTPVTPYQADIIERPLKRAKACAKQQPIHHTSQPTDTYIQPKRTHMNRSWKTQRTTYPQIPTFTYTVPEVPQQASASVTMGQVAIFQVPQSSSYDLAQVALQSQRQAELEAQIAQAELLSQTLAVAQRQAEIHSQQLSEQLAMQQEENNQELGQAQLPEPQHETHHEDNQQVSELFPQVLQLDQPSEQMESDGGEQPLVSTSRHPWQLRRNKRNSSVPFSSSSKSSDAKPEAPLKFKVSKYTNLEAMITESTEPTLPPAPTIEKPEAKKRRFFKPKREKDEDYEAECREDEDDDDDEEYREPLRTKRPRAPKKKQSAISSLARSCKCKICTVGIPSSFPKPLEWTDIGVLALSCLANSSRVGTRCFNLQTEIFPFVDTHYNELVRNSVHRNSWKKKMQSALANTEFFVCIKEDRAAGTSELWALRADQDIWTTANDYSETPCSPVSDYDSDDTREFEEEMNINLIAMREQLAGAKNQRDTLLSELDRTKKDVRSCTDSLYNIVISCSMAANSENFGAKLFDDIFEEIFEDIHQLLGDSAEKILG